MNGTAMAVAGTMPPNGVIIEPVTRVGSLQRNLAYNEMTVGNNGGVVSRAEKAELRTRHGYCRECEGVPIQLYVIKKSRLNPLWVTREPRAVAGECAGGICFVCHPESDPHRRRHRNRVSNNSADQVTGGTVGRPSRRREASDASHDATSTAHQDRNRYRGNHHSPVHHFENSNFGASSSGGLNHAAEADSATSGGSSGGRRGLSPSDRRPPDQGYSEGVSGGRRASSPSERRPPDRGSSGGIPGGRRASSPSERRLPDRGYSEGVARGRRTSSPSERRQPERRNYPEGISGGQMTPSPSGRKHAERRSISEGLSGGGRRAHLHREQRPPGAQEQGHLEANASPAGSTSQRTQRSTRSLFQGVYVPEIMMEYPPGLTNEDQGENGDGYDCKLPIRPLSDHDSYPGQLPPPRQPSEGSLDHSMAQSSGGGSNSSRGPQSPIPSAAVLPLASSVHERVTLSDREISNIVEGIDSLVKDMTECGSSEFLADILAGAIREQKDVGPILSHCLGIVWDLCKESDPSRASMMAAGIPEDIIRSMKMHTQDALVQEKGCGAMWALGVNSDYRITLIRAGACQQIVNALQYFIATENLVRTAIGAMRTLSPESEAREIFKNVEASKVVSEAMVVHRGCVSIQRDGCAFLSNCAVNIEKQFVTVVPQEELDSIVQAMANHRLEPSVMQGACFALKNYTHEEKNCRTLRRCRDIDELILHAAQFHRAPSCIDDAADILERMHMSKIMDESLEDEACSSIRRVVDSQFNTPQAPRSILDFMRNYDWSPRVTAFCMQMFQRIAEGPNRQIHNLFSDGLYEQIIRYALRFDEEVEVSREVCSFLNCVAEPPTYRQALVDAGACQIIFTSLVCGRSDENLVLNAFRALRSLLTVKECYEQFLDKMGLVTEAVAAHSSSMAVQVAGTMVFSALDTPPS